MKYNDLTLGSYKKSKRLGRGIATGKGKTAGRGTKGQNSRAGSSKNPGFEGGQNPLMQRLPKLKGFHSHKVKNDFILSSQLNKLKSKTINNETLVSAGLVENQYTVIKVLHDEPINKQLNVRLQAASVAAINSITAAGGTFEKVARIRREKSEVKTDKK